MPEAVVAVAAVSSVPYVSRRASVSSRSCVVGFAIRV
jgi:hypothetical protein